MTEATLGTTMEPAVVFGAGRRPEQATQVAVAEFEGPLGLLLALIEAQRLDVLTVPLGALADAYLEALASLDADRLGNISAFVSVAAQLILIKSRALLPRPTPTDEAGLEAAEAGDPEAELRARLLIYRAHRDAGQRLLVEAQVRVGLFRREPATALSAALAGARAPELPPLDPALLVGALDGLARLAPPPEPPPEVFRRTITLTERAAALRAALRGAPAVVLQDLLRGVRDRTVVAVTFLAMLELVKRREIAIEQAEAFGPIVARRTTAAERAAAGLVGDPEALPLDESLESFR